MATREYIRVCKKDNCKIEFVVNAPSLDDDRAIGFSEPEYCPEHRKLQVKSYSRIACHHFEMEMTPFGEQLTHNIEARLALSTDANDGMTFDPWALPPNGYGPGGLGRYEREVRGFRVNESFQPTKKPADFEISKKGDELLQKLEENQVVVLVGTTGSGKSTYIPWLLLTGGEPGKLSKWAKRGPICVTQPRIQATRQVPEFIAHALNGTSLGAGAQVGFSHSGADEFDRRTRLVFKTDGKLINDIVSGAVANYSIIMIDEAHERSVNIDLILGLMRDQLYLYPHLRLIIASATINEQTFIDFFGLNKEKQYIFSQGRQHDIHKHWWGETVSGWQTKIANTQAQDKTPVWNGPASSHSVVAEWWQKVNGGQQPEREKLPRAIMELVEHLCKWLDSLTGPLKEKEEGHILVFLPGSREIDQTVDLINSLGLEDTIALPLYSQRPLEEQQAALKPDEQKHKKVFGKRRVVVSTNVAETSLTVENVKHVIETGFIKESYWDPIDEITDLRTVRHSKAGCRQRWGRAGRVTDGHVYMFYSEQEFEDFPDDSTPEIARASLEQVILTAKRAGVRTLHKKVLQGQTTQVIQELDFAWMPLPSDQQEKFHTELRRAYTALQGRGAIDKDGDLTPIGLELGGFAADMEVARIYVEAERHAMGLEAATLLPFLKLAHGLQSLLKWNEEGDTSEKYARRLAHQNLVFGCRDDLELFLKLWLLWEAKTNEERDEWEREAGVKCSDFTRLIADEREKILEAAMDWRKAEKRNVMLSCCDALRALIASCLPNEIYVPIERKDEDQNAPQERNQFTLSSAIDGIGYEEYDDSLSFDESLTEKTNVRQGVYCRARSDGSKEKDLIEISPTSVCFDREDAEVVVACQRSKNWRRPARTKVLGMNMIRLDALWLDDINDQKSPIVRKARLYSRLRKAADEKTLLCTLFLPWLLPRQTVVNAIVTKQGDEDTLRITLTIPQHLTIMHGTAGDITVQGSFIKTPVETSPRIQMDEGTTISVEIVDYAIDANGLPVVYVCEPDSQARSFERFANSYQAGNEVEVEMVKTLPDPLGRNPLFMVRELASGLEVPMADTDFCSNTRPQSYFGQRFLPGERFQVTIERINHKEKKVQLSRGMQLLKEYFNIRGEHNGLVKAIVRRCDASGVYLDLPTQSDAAYVAFIRNVLWSGEISREVGQEVEARLRFVENQLSRSEIQERLEKEHDLPEELSLGVELDVRGPCAFDRLLEQSKIQEGYTYPVLVEKHLDNNRLLVTFIKDCTAIIFAEELGVDAAGKFQKAKDYEINSYEKVRVIKINRNTKKIQCSLFCVRDIPPDVVEGQPKNVQVLAISPDNQQKDIVRITACLEKKYCVKVRVEQTRAKTLKLSESILVKNLMIDFRGFIKADLADAIFS